MPPRHIYIGYIGKIVGYSLAGIAALFVTGVLALIIFLVVLSQRHTSQLNQLKTETSTIFSAIDATQATVTAQTCNDVELRNQCTVDLKSSLSADAEKAYVSSYLAKQGFTNSTYNSSKKAANGKHTLVVEYGGSYVTTYYQ